MGGLTTEEFKILLEEALEPLRRSIDEVKKSIATANSNSPGHNHFRILDDITDMDVVVGHRGNSLITLFEPKRLSSLPISHEALQNYRRQAITHNKQRTDGGRDDEKEKFR